MKKMITVDVLNGKEDFDERVKEIGWFDQDGEQIFKNLCLKNAYKAMKELNIAESDLAAGVLLACFNEERLDDEDNKEGKEKLVKALFRTMHYIAKDLCTKRAFEMMQEAFNDN